ncbi:hypothetical protein [Variovorax sp. PAMC 28711]|uniref:COG4648 family protein n=1 Tax=Variovorax sp. PAMC 28711 TaxID=1795631 RepID=UPI00078DFFD5|nr:hypothetical protein [Variovorax sp. PAMC 28711]AMM26241.1 hypothetical protein AX767_19200 [Variovorax sp. PAMC 28711]
MSRSRLALLLIAGVGYAVLSHWMMLYHATAPWAIAVLLGPLWLTALGMGSSRFGAWGFAATAAAGIAFFVVILRGDAGDPDRLYVMQHVGINAVLCGWFGLTLRGDGLSLIGQVAQRIHALTPDMRVYTAQVTAVWTAYFAVMAIGSLTVYLTLPFATWSFLSNLVGPISVGALFIGEHVVRYRLHPEFERVRIVDAVRAFSSPPVDRTVER